MKADSFAHPSWKDRWVYVFHPDSLTPPIPAVCFAPGFNVNHFSNNLPFIRHIVSRGFLVIFVPYPAAKTAFSPSRTPGVIVQAIEKAARRYEGVIDTSRIGFVSHSMGASFSPAALCALSKKGWGRQASFMHLMAPWYTYTMNPRELLWFPYHTQTCVQVFEDDPVNDHRIAIDLFENLGVGRKIYATVFSDSIEGKPISARHGTPSADSSRAIHPLAVMGVFRIFDALVAASLFKDARALAFLSSTGGHEMRSMRIWPSGKQVKPMKLTASPRVCHPECFYINFWHHELNPRMKFHSWFSASKPLRYRQRLTARNYLKKTSFAAKRYNQTGGRPRPVSWSGKPAAIVSLSFPHPVWGRGDIHIYLPARQTAPAPLIVMIHGYPWTEPEKYRGLITALVSRGYGVVFPSYALCSPFPRGRRRCDIIVSGVLAGVELVPERIDTTRIGFVGHGFGAAAVPAIMHTLTRRRQWGRAGLFGFMMAPWYTLAIDSAQMQQIPDHAVGVVQQYTDQRINSWRLGKKLFRDLPLSRDNKAYVGIQAPENAGFRANHRTPLSVGGANILDSAAVYRAAGAAAKAAFDGKQGNRSLTAILKMAREKSAESGGGSDTMVYTTDPRAKRKGAFSIFW